MDTTLRDAIGQALNDEMQKHPAAECDWCDSREIDRLADAVIVVLKDQADSPNGPTIRDVLDLMEDELLSQARDPIQMILFCPSCGLQHIDAPEYEGVNHEDGSASMWDNPPHRSHLCHGCGHIWRPADVATEGVASIQTRGKADTYPAMRVQAAPADVITRAKVLGAAGMELAANLCQLGTTTVKGVDYLRRDSVMSEVIAWRGAFDNAPKIAANPRSDVPNGYRLTDNGLRYGSRFKPWADSGWSISAMIEEGYLEPNPSTGMRCPSCCAPKGAVHAAGCKEG